MSLVLVLSPTLTNQGSTLRPLSLDLMLPQHQPNQDYCFLVSVMRVKLRQLHQMADSTTPSLGGHVIQWYYLLSYTENYWGFQGYSPFHDLQLRLGLPGVGRVRGVTEACYSTPPDHYRCITALSWITVTM